MGVMIIQTIYTNWFRLGSLIHFQAMRKLNKDAWIISKCEALTDKMAVLSRQSYGFFI